MIKFITEEEDLLKTFGNVSENQFFVDDRGNLYQKYDSSGANRIAGDSGNPCCSRKEFKWDEEIKQILPKTKKIRF